MKCGDADRTGRDRCNCLEACTGLSKYWIPTRSLHQPQRREGTELRHADRAKFVRTLEEICGDPAIDLVDVCTFPEFRLPIVEACARNGKHLQVQKPIAADLITARKMIEVARAAGIRLAVVSQHRFDDSSIFLSEAIAAGRLGRLIQCDCYVKWYRPPDYYSRPVKGTWKTEGGGALINQAIHQVDLLRWFAGPVAEVFGFWQLGAVHKIESEDVICARCAICKWRYGSDSGVYRYMARISGAH